MTDDQIGEIVAHAVQKELSSFLIKLGIDEDEHKELRADFIHLRKWRRSVEQMESYTFRTVITVVITGFLGAVWLGVKAVTSH